MIIISKTIHNNHQLKKLTWILPFNQELEEIKIIKTPKNYKRVTLMFNKE